ncbi:hypothetical protein [Photobacterium kishitanii]|uniref:Uncharacterized protein n=1 Tax=Photobacterium kishitanii TaxID=318456 RepID=A0A2T3KKY8_9GAMM|nr:hypothetical protein [Photobacterium kishitanii]PSV00384.1 hypothetical protein C9J27_04450 [Photobacterium kishitanii]
MPTFTCTTDTRAVLSVTKQTKKKAVAFCEDYGHKVVSVNLSDDKTKTNHPLIGSYAQVREFDGEIVEVDEQKRIVYVNYEDENGNTKTGTCNLIDCDWQ